MSDLRRPIPANCAEVAMGGEAARLVSIEYLVASGKGHRRTRGARLLEEIGELLQDAKGLDRRAAWSLEGAIRGPLGSRRAATFRNNSPRRVDTFRADYSLTIHNP